MKYFINVIFAHFNSFERNWNVFYRFGPSTWLSTRIQIFVNRLWLQQKLHMFLKLTISMLCIENGMHSTCSLFYRETGNNSYKLQSMGGSRMTCVLMLLSISIMMNIIYFILFTTKYSLLKMLRIVFLVILQGHTKQFGYILNRSTSVISIWSAFY